ncbi:molybdate metabolism regulator [Escherichia coli]|uniref:Twice split molybdate metabolism regulator n=1 Tax=Escherichia coli DEC2D TaxID=868141 RepID=A0A828U742_ECOLX|nr:putative molybdate metabolism regulator [Escherichia coli 2362-75]EHU08771.1 twice split molybdate metabolism regulator [Escherichia coli DEC1A]EHU09745.1 twice split molybdate metabolism regulator [Escherichia coli DEC1C]EHU17127.1 twice split molybdate metabolism regulator [Escherichia coli DEC1B]EHU22346.1 putative molybdate metabolism regulator [Escherichia coli DEC1D]EHU25565.1 twice split molybdate metabolism regulator [Escherichia coli DEC1E]EHU44996.1 twice split molybdate metaboli
MRHFIYQDEKSHKFWAVEQQGNKLHISWGKIGTNGQNQVKSFADAAATEKAELKLIAEKVKKGYVEQAKDNSLQPSQTVTDSLKVADLSTIIQEQPSFVAETRAADKNIDAVLPWLAKDIAVVFPPEVVHTTLSHRRFPGVPVQQADKLTQLRRLACSVSQRDNKTATFDFSACSLEWQNTVAQAISQIDGLKTTQLPSPVMAVLTALEMKCTRYKEREDVMDQIIQEGGLEYATDVIIHLQQISIEWDYVNNNIVFLSSGISPDYLQQYSSFELRLRKHLSLAEESLWQKCAQKLIAAIPHIPEWRQPLIALLLPEKPEIAHEIAQRLLGQKKLPSLEWLKIVATDEHILASLEKYHEPYAIFDDYYCGAIWSATVLQEQGVAALPRFTPYVASDYCADVLRHINHPFALTLLIRVAGHTKRCHDRMTKACAAFPHAALAALAELLVQKEENSWRIMLMTMLISQPTLAEQVIPWLSTPAVAVLKSCQQQLTQPSNHASADLLPAIVVSPPWLSKKKKSPIPVLDLAPLNLESICTITDTEAKEFQTHWNWEPHKPGEGAKNFLYSLGYRRWDFDTYKYIGASDSAIDAWEREDFATLIQMFKAHHAPYQGEWHLNSLPFLPMQKAIKLWEFLSKEPHTAIKPVMLYLRLAGMSGFLHSFSRYPQEGFAVANYFAATELAPAVARAFNKLKTLRQDARIWLLKYPEHAITGLLPAALGKTGEAQDNARAALRMLTENGHQPLLQEIARRYNQPEVTDAVNALLALDPLDNHPTKIPTLPTFYQPSLWTRPLLKANAQSLPDSALLHLGEMLRFPQEEALYPGLLQVKDACTTDSLAEFAWDLFTAWQTAGAPSKESWAFTALGVLGNDDTARKLTPLIRAWPGESQHKRATVGLDILAAIGSDIALMQLNGIAQKLKFKALQERAKEKIADIAESRELTVAELEDRLAPDLGLDDNGSLLLDFGPRQFTVSFDETLKPFVRDVSGSRLKDLPKPNKSDDESQANDAVNRYKLLKKDARTVAAQQVARMESAMCLRRRWSPENFQLFLVEHPLVRHLTRRLIWGVYSAENQLLACFRVAEDNSYSTADDDLFTLPEGDISIGIPHVLEISPTDAAAFGQLFTDYELLPPFRQLDRNSYALTEAERNASELTRWAGRKCPSGRVMGLANKGWMRGEPQDGGWIGWMIKPLGRWSLIMEIDEGFAVGMSPAELSAEQLLSKLWLWEGKRKAMAGGVIQHRKRSSPYSMPSPPAS